MERLEFDSTLGARYKDFSILCPHEPFLQYTVREILPRIIEATDPSILEIGTGTGRTLTEIIAAKPESKVTAVDISKTMLDQARHQIGERENLSYVEADAYNFLQRQSSDRYDVVISAFTVHNIPEKKRTKILSEVARVIKPQGWVIFADKFDYGQKRIDEHVLQQEIDFFRTVREREGLEELAQEWIIHYQKDSRISRSLEHEIKLLKKLGFTHFNLYFRYHMEGVYYAQKKGQAARALDYVRKGANVMLIPSVITGLILFTARTKELEDRTRELAQVSRRYEERRKDVSFRLNDFARTSLFVDSEGKYVKETIEGRREISRETFLAYKRKNENQI